MDYRVKVKIVPDDQPNADGQWMPIVVEGAVKSWKWNEVEAMLSLFIPPGQHMVAYQIEKEKE